MPETPIVEEITAKRPTGKRLELFTREAHGIQPIGILDHETGNIYVPRMDTDKNTLRVGLYVWDSDSGTWEKMEQPTINLHADDLTVTMGDVEKLLSDTYWNREEFEYEGVNLVFHGKHVNQDASYSDPSWRIKKLSWSAGKIIRIERLVGAYADRATLGWIT